MKVTNRFIVVIAGLASAACQLPDVETETATDGQQSAINDVVEISTGKLRGNSPDEKGIRSFLGVPFAAAPIGPLRMTSGMQRWK